MDRAPVALHPDVAILPRDCSPTRAPGVSGERTKKAAVTLALEEFIARRRQRGLLELMGKLEWDPGYDYKQERQRGATTIRAKRGA